MSKIVLVGANHAGIAAANTILDNFPENELTILDRNTNLSYLGCGTALWVGRQISGSDDLFYTSKEVLENKGAKIQMEVDVTNIDFDKKVVTKRNLNGEEALISYDTLILGTGSLPVAPNIKGNDLENIHFVKLFQDSQKIDVLLDREDVQNVTVVGAGYIGVEMAEAAQRRGKNVRIVEAASTTLSTYYDEWFTDDMDAVMSKEGITLSMNQTVTEFKGVDGKVKEVVTTEGTYETDLVIMAIGFIPNTQLGKGVLETLPNGAYLVDKHQRTSRKDVYAIGDCASIYSNALQETTYIALATNAVRSGIVAGYNVCGVGLEAQGVQGSNGISIYGYNMVSTGLNTAAAKKAGYDVKSTQFEDTQLPGFMADNHNVKIRITYDAKTRRVLGAQIASYADISMGIHMFSLAIVKGVTIDELKLVDIFFLPHFNQPYNYITMAALSAE